MDEFLRDIHTSIFFKWVLARRHPLYTVKIDPLDATCICIDSAYAHSEVTFNAQNIIEMSVSNTVNDRVEFYLHFQMNTLKHAIELYEEMVDTILKISTSPKFKVLLSCTSGATTGFFSRKLNEVAEMLGLDYIFNAVPYSRLFELGHQYDIILLAPQIAYLKNKIQQAFKYTRVLTISSKVFAKYDCGRVLKMLEDVSTDDVNNTNSEIPLKMRLGYTMHKKTLVISVIRDEGKVYIDYRLYDRNHTILLDQGIIKTKISILDISDILDTVLIAYPDIEMVGLSMPGIVNEGRLYLVQHGFDNFDVISHLSMKYPQKFVLCNDVNCIVTGYYASQTKYQNISFIFQPKAGYAAGIGSIIHGQLVRGYQNVAGEVQYLPMDLPSTKQEMSKTFDGSLELMAKTLVSLISLLGPELIVVSCLLISDIEKLKEEMKKYIPSQYIPEIIFIDSLKEYNLLGQLILCIQEDLKEKNH